MATQHSIIESFADEVLVFLFCRPNLGVRDILNLSRCCKRFYNILKSDEIWKCQLHCRFSGQSAERGNCYNVFKKRYFIEKQVNEYLLWLMRETFNQDGIPKKVFERVHSFFGIGNENVKYILHTLETLWKKDPSKDPTVKLNFVYHAEKLYRYVYHYTLKIKLIKLLNSDDSNRSLEKGALLISKWNNPKSKLDGKIIFQKLDDIVSVIRSSLEPEDLKDIKNVKFEHVRHIISVINKVLYKEMKFTGNTRQYYNVENSFIDKILEKKTGIPITLSILYIAIARRLGLIVHGVNFPNHFIIRVTVKETRGDQYLYIDCFDNGEILTEDECLDKFMLQYQRNDLPRSLLFEVADDRKILIRMVANVTNIFRQNSVLSTRNLYSLQTCLELMLLLAPHDDENRLLLSRIYLHQGINLEEVVENLTNLFRSNHNLPTAVLDSLLLHAKDRKKEKKSNIEVKCRSKHKEVEYRVGMIMKHRRYDYLCVIYGWDPTCCMSESWKQQMRVYDLPNKDKQPYYNVLAHDGSNRYAAQENLEPTQVNHPINHPEIGKYFESFNGHEYIASEMLNECYPEDQPFPTDNEQPMEECDTEITTTKESSSSGSS